MVALVVIPLAVLGLAIALPWMPRRAWPVRTLLTLAMVYALLTVVGVWFRGENMALVWPW